jgi:hypothetical protein
MNKSTTAMSTIQILFKTCTSCKENLSSTHFTKDSRRKDGLRSYCKQCYKKKYGHPDKKRDQQLRYVYGINQKDYEELLNKQGGGCAICGQKPSKKPLSVDHCHKTGKVRGLLCQKHNVAIGLLNEDPDLFDAAKKYLQHHRDSN